MTKRIRTYVLLLITLFTFCGCYDPTPYLGTWVTDIEEEDGYDGTLKLMLKEDDNIAVGRNRADRRLRCQCHNDHEDERYMGCRSRNHDARHRP